MTFFKENIKDLQTYSSAYVADRITKWKGFEFWQPVRENKPLDVSSYEAY